MNQYFLDGASIDSVDLKCMVVSRGVKVDKGVYKRLANLCRLDKSPLCCNCFLLPDGTVVQLTDMGFHLQYLTGMLSWDNLKLLRYASQLGTPFTLAMEGDTPALFHNGKLIDTVQFPDKTDFYRQRTAAGLPFAGNSVLQGLDWVAFQCLWPCEYAAAGEPCEFCFSGAEFKNLASKKKPLPGAVSPGDVAEIVAYAVKHQGCSGLQITGGSTFNAANEAKHIERYLQALREQELVFAGLREILLYITPPQDTGIIDSYFELGATRVACSLEVWDKKLAAGITPGKIQFTTRKRHLDILEYVAQKYGHSNAFSNFIIGIEPLESLCQGAAYLAQRGILPSASVWMPMGMPVQGTMQAPDVAYFQQTKEYFAELYIRHGLEPAAGHGLNVCIERDIWRYAYGDSKKA